MNAGKVFLGVLVGVAVGATLGILFAPAKGSKTRQRIVRKKDEYVGDMEEKFNDFIGTVTERLDRIRGEASRIVKGGQQEAEEVEAEVIAAVKGKKQ
jgi:gas vesicle protein